MKILFTDRNTFFDAQGLAYHNKGGWGINYKTPKVRRAFFKKHFCGNLLKADLTTVNFN